MQDRRHTHGTTSGIIDARESGEGWRGEKKEEGTGDGEGGGGGGGLVSGKRGGVSRRRGGGGKFRREEQSGSVGLRGADLAKKRC